MGWIIYQLNAKKLEKISNSSSCKEMKGLTKCQKKLACVLKCNWTKLGGGLTTNNLKSNSWFSTFLMHCT